ncbi:hypothetical protein BX600DRAFT_445032 [Xylariales sp. PMI_506]|nr:hypothetical protein BX600DRAFT_445032 [Xylariales sp. PMI_506]
MATELSRVAGAALRTAHSLRSATPRASLPTASLVSSMQILSLSGPSQQRYKSAWTSHSRPERDSYAADTNLRKPTEPSSTPTISKPTGSAPSLLRGHIDDKPKPARSPFDASVDDSDYTTHFIKGELSKRFATDADFSIVAKRPEVRCVSRTGRTIHVSKGSDVRRAFAVLGQQCSSNRVQADFHRQRAHERPGLKRKRLKSQRWQRRFKIAFKATCKRVDELRRQGW